MEHMLDEYNDNWKIYRLIEPETLKTKYVGATSNTLDTRLNWHIRDAKQKCPCTYRELQSSGEIVRYDLENKHCWIKRLLEAGKKPLIEEIMSYAGYWKDARVQEFRVMCEFQRRGERLFNYEIKSSELLRTLKTIEGSLLDVSVWDSWKDRLLGDIGDMLYKRG